MSLMFFVKHQNGQNVDKESTEFEQQAWDIAQLTTLFQCEMSQTKL